MAGVKDFLTTSLPAMSDYISVVSVPLEEPHSFSPAQTLAKHNRITIMKALRERASDLTVLNKEAIPLLPHLLDIPRHLAVITSAVIRSSRDPALQPQMVTLKGTPLEDFCMKCFGVEERALVRVTKLAQRLALDKRRPSLPTSSLQVPGPSFSNSTAFDPSLQSPRSGTPKKTRITRPSTAPSSGSPTTRRFGFENMPTSPPPSSRYRSDDPHRQFRRPAHIKAPSTDSVPLPTNGPLSPREGAMDAPYSGDLPEDTSKRKKGGNLLKSILRL